MKFIGVDYSTKKISVGAVDTARSSATAVSFALGRHQTDYDENLRALLGKFREWAVDFDGQVAAIAIEAPIVGTSGASRTAVRMGMVAGAIFAEATTTGAEIVVPAPMQWRKAVCGKGNMKKEEVVAWLRQRHPALGGVNDDEADAVCLAMFAQQTFGPSDL